MAGFGAAPPDLDPLDRWCCLSARDIRHPARVAARLAASGLRVADLALRRPTLDDPDGTALRRLGLGLGLLAGRLPTTSSAPTGHIG